MRITVCEFKATESAGVTSRNNDVKSSSNYYDLKYCAASVAVQPQMFDREEETVNSCSPVPMGNGQLSCSSCGKTTSAKQLVLKQYSIL